MKRNLITANDLAERLGLKSQTVYLWVRQKRIPFYRLGRLIKFDEQEVLAHLKVEAENNESSQKQTGQRITIRKGGTIDLHRPDSGLTSEQRKRYKALLGME